MLGYMCAYLRCYYPYEFITAYLNHADGDEDVRAGTALASKYEIKITPPKFGASKDQYMFDKEDHVIAKGVSSVKFLNKAVANELYEVAKAGRPETFMDLLKAISQETSLNARQREILIKLDFFSHYGNAKELLKIVDFFMYFKQGTAKSVSKAKVAGTQMDSILAQYATDKNAKGEELKSFTIIDMHGLLRQCESLVREMKISDFSFGEKIGFQKEFLGYVDLTTGLGSDRRKLLISEVRALKSKATGKPWAYAIRTRSIGSGKESDLTIKAYRYDMIPVKDGDVVYARDVRQDERGYWHLMRYDKITL